MCFFVGRIQSVKRTRILVSPLENKRQLIVYENKVETQLPGRKKNAMVLPVPSGQEIRLFDLSEYPGGDLWKECESLIPAEKQTQAGKVFGGGVFGGGISTLEVYKVGGYQCSIVPTLDDFIRLSQGHFVVPANIAEILKTNYGVGFSFIVCVFDNRVAGHPIAYTSARLPNDTCFIPTRHAHGGDDTQEHQAMQMHPNVQCDGCEVAPLIGLRWKCLQCYDFDLCDTCFTAGKHNTAHPFARLANPLRDNFELQQLVQQGLHHQQEQHTNGDEFDHTIYLINSVLAAPPSRYTDLKQGKEDRFETIKLCRFVPEFGPVTSIVRVYIEGAFPNDDYKAVPHDF
jgi:hypothetical protein